MVRLSDNLTVRHYGASYGGHAHAHFQILLGLEGTLSLEIEGRGLQVPAGAGVVIAPGDKHDSESQEGSRCLVLDTGNAAWQAARNTIQLPSQALHLSRYLAHASTQGHPQAQLMGPALLLEAWLPQPSGPRAGRRIAWDALGSWATVQPTAPSVADLANRVHLSAAQLSARCLQELGQSPMHWVRRQRLTQARAWLNSGMSVAQTARRAGYRSASALTAAMRKEQI